MGVHKLETFLEQGQPNAYCHEVSIEELTQRYTAETGRQPVIVVDGTNFLYNQAYKSGGDNDWLMGGQLDDCINNLKRFITKFQDIGVKLIFFFDGATPTRRRHVWIQRKAERIKRIQAVFRHLKGRQPMVAGKMQNKPFFQQPALIGAIGRFMIKYVCGAEVRVAAGDCDLELATFAKRENHCAVMAQDSDFVILESAQYYLSTKHLDLETMTTLLYPSREKFARELEVQVDHLPLLGTLLGNDSLSFSELYDHHLRLVETLQGEKVDIHQLVAATTEYIRTLPTGKEVKDMLPDIAANYLQDSSLLKGLQDGVESYSASSLSSDSFDDIEDQNWKEIMQCAKERHTQCQVPTTLYSILLGNPYELGQSVEDFSDKQFPCVAEVYKQLRRRIYSILLHEQPGANTSVEEWCIYRYELLKGENIPIGELPRGIHHPGLLALWNGCTPDIQAQRWELFVQSVAPGLDTARVRGLPMKLVVPTLALSYIRQECHDIFEDWEVDAILLLAVVRDSTNMAELRALPPTYRPLVRAVQCSTLYSRGITTVLLLAAACGIPQEEVMPWHYFDGKLFYKKYLEARNRAAHRGFGEKQPDLVTNFGRMRTIVFSTPCSSRGGQYSSVNYEEHHSYQLQPRTPHRQ